MEDGELVRKKNEVRNTITTFFRERDCAVLFRPVTDEKKLREVNHLDYEELRPQFRVQVEELL